MSSEFTALQSTINLKRIYCDDNVCVFVLLLLAATLLLSHDDVGI